MTTIVAQPLTADNFAPYGTVIELRDAPDQLINQGRCGRHHDVAQPDIVDGRAGISLFSSEAFTLPFQFEMVERHPLGSQAFLPLHRNPFLVIIAPDDNGTPGTPLAFLTAPGQGINITRNTWHGVLTPLAEPGLFAVIDRIGDGPNLEEHWYDVPYSVIRS